jgi:hypothetical protein
MLKFKSLFATALLCGTCVISFAQPPSPANNAASFHSKSSATKAAKAKSQTGKSKSHVNQRKKASHPATKKTKGHAAKKHNDAPIGLQAY